MAFTSLVKSSINRFLKRINLKLESLTLDNKEQDRLKHVEQSGHFLHPVFNIPSAFKSTAFESILEDMALYKERFCDFEDSSCNEVGYTYDNSYFTSPDAEVLYTIVRKFKPNTVVEVGCGNSTKITRQAILDGQLQTHLISIDPQPRTEISELVDKVYLKPVEDLDNLELFRSLKEGDILFIDSSHQLKVGNDVWFLYLNVIPELPPGVLLHIHDIFLPYEYPRQWIIEQRWEWNEQYLVQLLLSASCNFEVLWAGHFLQRTQSDFSQQFPHLGKRIAQSLWLKKKN